MGGLGLFQAVVKKIPNGTSTVPNVGWRYPCFRDFDMPKMESKYYFTHSYYVDSLLKSDVVADLGYNGVLMDVICRNGNVYGIQFHPEKSHFFGRVLIRFILEQQ